ncbi:hypothetical protein [Streptomyces eurythermus]|uniref:hypothetical protein n=1 Tax=Streptomyces eurythermus TaxID=42237 RepID=UPI0036FC07AF
MLRTYVYKQRLGPWGLLARVTLDVRSVGRPPSEARGIGGSRVWWLPPHGLPPADERWMTFGLELVAGQLELLSGGAGAVLVRVDDWDVPMVTDYQDEVAAAALIECLQRSYGIPGVDIGLSFDRERNRYEFTWDGASAELDQR